MKVKIVSIAISLIWLATMKPSENTLTIQVSGIKNANGYVLVALHDGSSEFPDGEGFKTAAVEAESGSVEVTFGKFARW